MLIKDARILYDNSISNNYALPAFNICSLDSLQAILFAAEAEKSPLIVQVIHFTEKYVRDVDTYLEAVKLFIEKTTVPVLLQHDHCSSVEEAKRAIDRGFGAVMYDGSFLPYKENVETTSEVVEYAHKKGVWVEAELGAIPSMEDTTFSDNVKYTDAFEADRFILQTGCDSLAISVGTAHGGVPSDDYLPFEFGRLKEITDVRPDYPFVLHGAASLPNSLQAYVNLYGGEIEPTHICSEEDIARACKSGIHKVNMDVDNWMAYTGALRQFFTERPSEFFPVSYLDFARRAWEEEARHKICHVTGSTGMANTLERR